MPGIGRLGGITGSFLVAELARRQLAFGQVFVVVAAAALVAVAALLVKRGADRHGPAGGRPVVRPDATLH